MNSYGADFVKKVKPLGAVIILLISALGVIIMFTADVTPPAEPEPEPMPQNQIIDDEYYLECVE
jgi:hypothetical protein